MSHLSKCMEHTSWEGRRCPCETTDWEAFSCKMTNLGDMVQGNNALVHVEGFRTHRSISKLILLLVNPYQMKALLSSVEPLVSPVWWHHVSEGSPAGCLGSPTTPRTFFYALVHDANITKKMLLLNTGKRFLMDSILWP